MCGIAAVCLGRVGDLSVVDLLEASFLLQHRGQDACGIATSDQTGSVYRHRDLGLAAEVFANPHNIADLYGHVGLLHCTLIKLRQSPRHILTYL
jgi:amidophosphoribosyltransferase